MSERDFLRAVAAATCESPRVVRRRGFQPVATAPDRLIRDGLRPPAYVDWDELERRRPVLFPPR